jgi:anti-anti-sigma factor
MLIPNVAQQPVSRGRCGVSDDDVRAATTRCDFGPTSKDPPRTRHLNAARDEVRATSRANGTVVTAHGCAADRLPDDNERWVIWADRLPPVDVGTVAVDLNLHVQGRIGGGTVIVARGDLDHGAVERFRACVDQVLQPPPGTLYVDVRLVTFVDSSGIGALVFAHKQAERVGTRLVLQHPSDALLRTLRTVDLLGFFGLPPT